MPGLTISLKTGCIFILLTVISMATARNFEVVYGKYTVVWKYTGKLLLLI
jgi:hypothetical protein